MFNRIQLYYNIMYTNMDKLKNTNHLLSVSSNLSVKEIQFPCEF